MFPPHSLYHFEATQQLHNPNKMYNLTQLYCKSSKSYCTYSKWLPPPLPFLILPLIKLPWLDIFKQLIFKIIIIIIILTHNSHFGIPKAKCMSCFIEWGILLLHYKQCIHACFHLDNDSTESLCNHPDIYSPSWQFNHPSIQPHKSDN